MSSTGHECAAENTPSTAESDGLAPAESVAGDSD
jgi:hypothetical protein